MLMFPTLHSMKKEEEDHKEEDKEEKDPRRNPRRRRTTRNKKTKSKKAQAYNNVHERKGTSIKPFYTRENVQLYLGSVHAAVTTQRSHCRNNTKVAVLEFR